MTIRVLFFFLFSCVKKKKEKKLTVCFGSWRREKKTEKDEKEKRGIRSMVSLLMYCVALC